MYFSEELYNAEKLGYKFEVLWGYIFDSDYIFEKYINDLYNIRLNYPKTDPMNLIAKLLLNSLYGRFGMDDNFTFIEIINKKDYINFEKQDGAIESIIDIIEIGNNYMIPVKSPITKLKTDIDNVSETHNNNTLGNLYYSDTDSAYFDKPLPDSMIDPKRLGALKLEGVYSKGIFLAPKVYCLLDNNNNNIEIKIKGVNKKAIIDNNININLFESLLHKDYSFEIKQTKWFKSLTNSNITVKDQIYSLKVTVDLQQKRINL